MEEDIKAFLGYLAKEKKYSPNTVAAYRGDLNQLAAYAKAGNPKKDADPPSVELSAELLSSYIRNLGERKYVPSTLARKIATAKSFLKFMVDSGRLKDELASRLASPHVTKALPKLLSVSEVRRLLAEPAKLSTTEAKRDRAMLELLYATGLRASELMALNVDDIDLKAGSVRCSGRNSKVRVVPIDRYIIKVIKEYIDVIRLELLSNENESALFLNRRGERLTRQGFWQIVQGHANKAGLGTKVTPRALRHSFASLLEREGVHPHVLQRLARHSDIQTTMNLYTHILHGDDASASENLK